MKFTAIYLTASICGAAASPFHPIYLRGGTDGEDSAPEAHDAEYLSTDLVLEAQVPAVIELDGQDSNEIPKEAIPPPIDDDSEWPTAVPPPNNPFASWPGYGTWFWAVTVNPRNGEVAEAEVADAEKVPVLAPANNPFASIPGYGTWFWAVTVNVRAEPEVVAAAEESPSTTEAAVATPPADQHWVEIPGLGTDFWIVTIHVRGNEMPAPQQRDFPVALLDHADVKKAITSGLNGELPELEGKLKGPWEEVPGYGTEWFVLPVGAENVEGSVANDDVHGSD